MTDYHKTRGYPLPAPPPLTTATAELCTPSSSLRCYDMPGQSVRDAAELAPCMSEGTIMSSLPDRIDRSQAERRPDRMLDIDDFGEYLGLCGDFAYDQVRLGRLQGARIARQPRFGRADLDAFVDLHVIEAGGQGPSPVRLPPRRR